MKIIENNPASDTGLAYIRRYYGLTAARRGVRICFTGDGAGKPARYGAVVGSSNARLRVRFDGEKYISVLHPVWEVEYAPAHDPALAAQPAAPLSSIS